MNHVQRILSGGSIVFNETHLGNPTAVNGHIRYTQIAGGDPSSIWDAIFDNVELYDWIFAQAVPEQSTLSLAGIGLMALAGRRSRFGKAKGHSLK